MCGICGHLICIHRLCGQRVSSYTLFGLFYLCLTFWAMHKDLLSAVCPELSTLIRVAEMSNIRRDMCVLPILMAAREARLRELCIWWTRRVQGQFGHGLKANTVRPCIIMALENALFHAV